MRPYTILRELTDEEHSALEEALKAPKPFARRRAQILRLSAQGVCPRVIAEGLGCSQQTVRNAIREFVTNGVSSLLAPKMGPKNPRRIFDGPRSQRLMGIVQQSPRAFGKARSTWTLALLAEVCLAEQITDELVSTETIRQAIVALGSRWQRARDWITSPDPQYAVKKSSCNGS